MVWHNGGPVSTYEVGYFSHREQKVLCFGDAVQVQPLKVALAVPLVTPVNEEFAFSWETATAIDASEDRFRIYTDDVWVAVMCGDG